MKIPQVNSCCFCIKLRTGALILGWLESVFSLIGIVSTVQELRDFRHAVANPDEVIGAIGPPNSNDLHVVYAKEKLAMQLESATTMQIIFYGHLIIFCLTFVSSIFLLIGVYRKRANLIFQWIVVTAISLMIAIVTQALQIIMTPSRGRSYFIWTVIIADFIGLTINLYYCMSMHSLYKIEKKKQRQPAMSFTSEPC